MGFGEEGPWGPVAHGLGEQAPLLAMVQGGGGGAFAGMLSFLSLQPLHQDCELCVGAISLSSSLPSSQAWLSRIFGLCAL